MAIPARLPATHPRVVPRALLVHGAVAVVCAAFLFLEFRTTPIVLWDESRIAVNALEMYLRGHPGLVTTFGSRPDLWNTKPPLLIWLIDLSMSAFGPSEWSLRLPSAVATMGTLALVVSFTKRVTSSLATSVLAAALLVFSVFFFGEHGARTADYEALLCFLTTGYLHILFFCLHRREPGLASPVAAATLVGLAILTKSIAGLLPGVGIVVYLVLVGRWRRPFQSPWYAVFGLLAMVGPVAFFVLRERAAPGYVSAALFNDVSGRFGQALDAHAGPPWYYLEALIADKGFSGGFLVALAPLALVLVRGKARLGLLYSLSVTAAIIVVLSFGATKLVHYAMTALPFMAIATAIALHETAKALARPAKEGRERVLVSRLFQVSVFVLLAQSCALALSVRTVGLPRREFGSQALYGELFRDLSRRNLVAPHVVEGGIFKPWVVAEGVPRDYAPQLDFYRLLANSTGMAVVRVPPSALDAEALGTVLASCDPTYTPGLRALGPTLTAVEGCVAVRQPSRRLARPDYGPDRG